LLFGFFAAVIVCLFFTQGLADSRKVLTTEPHSQPSVPSQGPERRNILASEDRDTERNLN
jgi:hypothetical protein